ncbi:hypothetical protein BDN70DRAFT_863343 [Pholiota conissans]|uniref:Uncharacterized protein n=1 Tax=Pholiota conissans TaxID=109636 RepID=A0A9P5YYS5_9AGAR|nr:hypothetical protein BDN70DRAFT_863343 [Pholiota conissans]
MISRSLTRRLRSYALFALLVYIFVYLIRHVLFDSVYSVASSSYPPLKDVVDTALDEEISKVLRSLELSAQKRSWETSRKKTLQSALLCSTRKGTWNLGATLNQTWPSFAPHEHCPGTYSNSTSTGRTAPVDVCQYLSGKKILFVGPDTTFYLHSLWLNSLEKYEYRSHTCLGRDFCTFHHICRRPVIQKEYVLEGAPPSRKKKMPSRNILLATNSSLLQYALSTTLHISKNEHDGAYTEPAVDQGTGIRMENTYWLRRARKTDILVINRGPVPAPAMTYAFEDHVTDKWAFAARLCKQTNYFSTSHCNANRESRLVNAALHATVTLFLPSVLQSLEVIEQDPDISKSYLIWHSSWFIQPSCAIVGIPPSIPLLREMWSGNDPYLVDPWSFYYNSQVYMHDRLLPQILAHFNFTYIPLTMSPFVKHSSARFLENHQDFSSKPKDCLRHPWPTFGVNSLEVVFFSALSKILHLL